MMKPTNLFTVSFYYVASSGVYYGTAVNKSPKKARALAEDAAYAALCEGDAKAGCRSGIAVDGWQMWRGGTMIGRQDNF